MAWTNIDDEFLIRNKHGKIAAKMEGAITKEEALVACIWLWRNSQEEMADSGTFFEILDWAEISCEEVGKKFISALTSPRINLLEKKTDGTFRVKGNRQHIENKKKSSNKAKKAAAKRWSKTKEIRSDENKEQVNAPSNAPSIGQAMLSDAPSNANTIQSNTIQSNAIQSNAIQSKHSNKESELEDFFKVAKAFWIEATGTTAMGNARTKISNHINSLQKKENLLEAIKNYGEVLKVETDRPIKTSLDTFIGSPERGLYYLDYIDVGCVDDARKRASRKNSVASQKKTKNQQLLENHQILFEKIERGEL